MTYDWTPTKQLAPLSEEWFADADRRFVSGSYPYLSHEQDFDRIMPERLNGMRVLEVGCGLGLHTQELIRRGANVTAVDLTEFAVKATTTRLERLGLTATVQVADAEMLPFSARQFDLVWSWGVIHHSSRTTRIVREIARVLQPSGEARLMVYNREGVIARLILLRHYLVGLEFRHRSPDETLWAYTDGYTARYYHPEQFGDLLRGYFLDVQVDVFGQEVDVIPLPRPLRGAASRWISDEAKLRLAARRGAFVFAVARNIG